MENLVQVKVRKRQCLRMSTKEIVRGGQSSWGAIVWGAILLVGNYPGGNSPGGNPPGGSLLGAIVRGGNYPGGNCPRTIIYMLHLSDVYMSVFYHIKIILTRCQNNFSMMGGYSNLIRLTLSTSAPRCHLLFFPIYFVSDWLFESWNARN